MKKKQEIKLFDVVLTIYWPLLDSIAEGIMPPIVTDVTVA